MIYNYGLITFHSTNAIVPINCYIHSIKSDNCTDNRYVTMFSFINHSKCIGEHVKKTNSFRLRPLRVIDPSPASKNTIWFLKIKILNCSETYKRQETEAMEVKMEKLGFDCRFFNYFISNNLLNMYINYKKKF